MRAMRTPTAQYSGASPDLMKLASNNLFKAESGKVEGIVAAIVDVIRLHQSARRKVA